MKLPQKRNTLKTMNNSNQSNRHLEKEITLELKNNLSNKATNHPTKKKNNTAGLSQKEEETRALKIRASNKLIVKTELRSYNTIPLN